MANERSPENWSRDLPPLERDFDEPAPTSGKVALFAIAIVLLLGAVFYGLNTSQHQAQNPSAQTAQSEQGLPQAPPGMRDVSRARATSRRARRREPRRRSPLCCQVRPRP